MTKLLIILFCGMLVVASLFSLGVHEPAMAYVLGLSKLWVVGRLALAFFLLSYYLFFPVRQRGITMLLRVTAGAMLYAGLSSVLWGSYASGSFIPVVDIVLLLEGGIVALLASFELPQYERAAQDVTSLKLNVVKWMQPQP